MNNRAIFFDRDGIVNKRIIGGYVTSKDEFIFLPKFFELFKIIKQQFIAILITNQQGIGKRLMTDEDLFEIHNFMQQQLLINAGYKFDDIFYCPDLAESNSFRRKPNPGMLYEAIEKWKINPSDSYMIGDSESDYFASVSARVNPILVGNFITSLYPKAIKIVKNLDELITYFKAII